VVTHLAEAQDAHEGTWRDVGPTLIQLLCLCRAGLNICSSSSSRHSSNTRNRDHSA
jgi:hypothetical protein